MKKYRFGLLGYPLKHSFSPQLHQVALESLGLHGSYELFSIPPTQAAAQEIQVLLDKLRQGSLHGLNVTIPYKTTAISFLDELSTLARKIGAVNAIFCNKANLVGENFDCPAFQLDLEFHLQRLGIKKPYTHNGYRAILLGAGGSARAVLYALLKDGWRVLVANRHLERARVLSRSFAEFPPQSACLLDDLGGQRLSDVQLVVNTTPLGMFPNPSASPWPAGLTFPPEAMIYDLVYNPLETAFMASARASGLPVANGLGMLARQAALSFQAWTGQAPDWKAMYHSLNPQLALS